MSRFIHASLSVLLFKLIYSLSSVYTFLSQQMVNAYGRYYMRFPKVHARICEMYSRVSLLYKHFEYFMNTRVFGVCSEPLEPAWTAMAHITNSHILVEDYQFRQNMDKRELIDIVNRQTATTLAVENGHPSHTYLRIVKYNDTCVYRVISPDSSCGPQSETMALIETNPSNVRLLSVEYTHPRMNHPIHIELPKSIYIAGNQILSAVFILRHLKYNHLLSSGFVFDDKYKIKVMDDNVDQFELGYGNYCTLDEMGYKIMG